MGHMDWHTGLKNKLHLEKQISKVYGDVHDVEDFQTRLTSLKASASLIVNKTHSQIKHRLYIDNTI